MVDRLMRFGNLAALAALALMALADAALAMPQVLLPVIVAGGAAAIAGTSVVAAVLTTAAVSAVSYITRPKPPSFEPVSATGALVSREQPVTEGVMIFGRRRVGGVRVARDQEKRGLSRRSYFGQIVVLACHQIDDVEEIWLGDTLVWTRAQWVADGAGVDDLLRGQVESEFKGKIGLQLRLGDPDQAAVSEFVALSDRWSDAARGRGVAYVYFEAPWNADLFSTGINSLPITAVVRGARVLDPRSGQTVWTSNPALILRHYALLPARFGGIGWTTDDIDDAAILALADVSDEQIPRADGGTEARYAFDGLLNTAATPRENLNTLAASWGGWWAIERGRLTVGGAAYDPPVRVITEGDLIGPLQGRRYPDYETRFNAVKARFADPARRYVATDLPLLSSATYAAEDGGEVIRDIGEVSGQTSAARAQRLMKLALFKARRERLFTLPCSLSVDDVRLGDTVAITLPRRGWDARTFEVTSRSEDLSPAGVRVTLGVVETSPTIFDWQASEETPLPAGPAVRDIFRIPPSPGVPAVSEALYATRDGTQAKALARLTWSRADYAFSHVYRVQARQIIDGIEGDWATLADTPDPFFDVLDIAPGRWDFRVATVTPRGRLSEWAQAAAQIQGLGAVPAALQGVSIQSAGGLAVLKWAAAEDLDVRIGGQIAIRHSPATAGATWSASRAIDRASGAATAAIVPLMPGSYLLRAEDSSGISGPVTVIAAQGATALAFANLATLQEDDDFTGAKSGVAVLTTGILELTDPVVAASGTYNFATGIDLGSAKQLRLRAEVSVVTTNLNDAWLQRPGSWLAWADWLGLGDGQGDAWIEARSTEDDPAGAPVWGPWARVDASELRARAIQARAILTTTDAGYSPAVSILRLQADEVA